MHSGQIAEIAPQALKDAIDRYRAVSAEDHAVLMRFYHQLKTTRPMLIEIMDAVVRHYRVETATITGDDRLYETVLARHVFMYMAHKYTRFSLPAIGKYCGGRDHTTILHAIHKIEKYTITRPLIAKDIETLQLRISEKVLRRIVEGRA